MRRLLFAVAAALLLSAQTAPPSNDAVLSHYRAYRIAFAAGDASAAEREADAALQASIARDGDGGRTGVLAINLAKVRLITRRAAEAYAPALRAFNIAANASSGLDPLLTQLLLGRAELTPEHATSGAPRLTAALEAAKARPDLAADAYAAAVDLGTWTTSQQKYDDSATAWSDAASFAGHLVGDQRITIAVAQINEGVARYISAERTENNNMRAGMGATGSYIRPGTPAAYQPAADKLSEAIRLLGPLALLSGADNNLTVAQSNYADALAWRRAIDARLASTDRSSLNKSTATQAIHAIATGAPAGSAPPCPMHVIAEPRPQYPSTAVQDSRFGVVVLRILANAAGQITDVRVAGATPPPAFTDAVERVASHWRIERDADAPAGCQVSPISFESVLFYLD